MDEVKIPITLFSNYVAIDVVFKQNGKIIIPDGAKRPEGTVENIVVAISNDKEKDGIPMVRNIKVGDCVMLHPNVRHTATEAMLNGKLYVLARESDIIGVLSEGWNENNNKTNLKLVTVAGDIVN